MDNKDDHTVEYQNEIDKIVSYGISKEKLIKVGYDYEQLLQIRIGLERGIDISKYLSKDFAWFQMKEIRKSLELGMDFDNLRKQGFNWMQLSQIRKGIESGVDTKVYTDILLDACQMREIRLGQMSNVNISLFLDRTYGWYQMEEIRLGLEKNVDVNVYLDPELSYYTMREIRKGLESGVDMTPFVSLDSKIIRQIRKAMISGINISKYINDGYDANQIDQIRKALQKKVDIEKYINAEYREECIKQIRIGLEKQIDVTPYATAKFNWQQMREIRKGIEDGIDVSFYAKPLCTSPQMREIRLGLEAGLNVKSYCSLMFSARDMQKKREQLLSIDPTELLLLELNKEIEESKVVITTSADKITAYLELMPKIDGSQYVLDEIMEILKSNGIQEGINIYAIKELIEKKQYNTKKIVAEGTEPIVGVDGYYEYFFDLNMPKIPEPLEDGFIDYRKIILFDQVVKGQKVAYYHSAKMGMDGVDVFGEILPAKRGKEQPILRGKGFLLDTDKKTYISSVNGKIQLKDNKILMISKICFVQEVTRATGDLFFDGSITVSGNVGSGVTIEATEDIIVEGNVESSFLKAGKNIIIKNGMVGGKAGKLVAGQSVIGRFFEQTEIDAEDEVKSNYFLNCEIKTTDKVTAPGRRGVIIGGRIMAEKGVEVGNLGNSVEVATYVEIGVNEGMLATYYAQESHMAGIKREILVYIKGKKKLEGSVPIENLVNVDAYKNILQAIELKQKEIDVLEQTVRENKRRVELAKMAKIIVSGTVYPKTTVKIDSRILIVDKEFSRVIIKKRNDDVSIFSNRGDNYDREI